MWPGGVRSASAGLVSRRQGTVRFRGVWADLEIVSLGHWDWSIWDQELE